MFRLRFLFTDLQCPSSEKYILIRIILWGCPFSCMIFTFQIRFGKILLKSKFLSVRVVSHIVRVVSFCESGVSFADGHFHAIFVHPPPHVVPPIPIPCPPSPTANKLKTQYKGRWVTFFLECPDGQYFRSVSLPEKTGWLV